MSQTVPDTCRLCLKSEGLMLPIFRNSLSHNETTFRCKIMSCTATEIFADDGLPAKVCYVCAHQIEKFFQFQTMCANSELVLRSQIKRNRIMDSINVIYTSNGRQEKENSSSSSEEASHDNNYNDLSACFICTSNFTSVDLLIDHLTKCHPTSESFICQCCQISFPNISQFKNHLKTEHNLKCDHCDRVFQSRKSLNDHLQMHFNKNFACKHCKKLFDNAKDAKIHELGHLEQTCRYCLKEFSCKAQCQKHTKGCIKKYYCTFCEQEVLSKKELIEHVNNCHDLPIAKCANCHQPITQFHTIESSKRKVADNKNQCKNCLRQPSNELTIETKENNKNLVACKFCAKKFSFKSSLRRHEKCHTGVKPFQCKYCQRQFKDSSSCIVHTRTHTGERPFQCQECPKDFKQLANLKMHTYRHHKRNNKVEDEKSVPNQTNNEFEQIYSNDIINKFTDLSARHHQIPDGFLTTLNQSINILISNQRMHTEH